jgi:ABC-type glycerol-3-phosphate transport system permease component
MGRLDSRQLECVYMAADCDANSRTFDDSSRYLIELKDSSSWVLIMTGASLSVIPLIVTFFIFQKQIIRGIALTGLK